MSLPPPVRPAEHEAVSSPCLTPPQRARPDRATTESELKRTEREYAQTGKSLAQLKAYLATL